MKKRVVVEFAGTDDYDITGQAAYSPLQSGGPLAMVVKQSVKMGVLRLEVD